MATAPIGDVSELENPAGSEEDSNGEGSETLAIKERTTLPLSESESETESDEFESLLSPEEKEEFLCEIEKASMKVSILCAGPTGVGKSTLLNGLVGSKEGERSKDKDDDRFDVGNSLKRGTSEVHKREFVKNGVAVTVWDTPGLEGRDDTDSDYLERIKEECADFDLFMYCIKADETRATEIVDEKSSLLKFTEVFGPELWKNGIIVLTFCNGVVEDLEEDAECNPDVDSEREFAKRIEEWRKIVHEALLRQGVDKKIVKNIPVVPAGSACSPHLPGYSFWLSHLFLNVHQRMKDDARVAYIILNQDRMRNRTEVDASTVGESEIQDQPLVEIAAGLGVAAVGAVTGATIGATIGALAIGIPTFGVFAAGGLVLGGAIGAGVGTMSGVGTGMLVRWFKKKRRRRNRK